MASPVFEDDDGGDGSRISATKAIVPFLLLGLADVVLLLLWGVDPLWGFAILPPILFISVLGWIAFRSGFVNGPVDDAADEPGGEAETTADEVGWD